MAIFPLFKKKEYFSSAEQEQIVDAIRSCETTTSGEIRVFIESKNPFVEPLDRAAEVFFKLEMDRTDHRNAVLLYVAMKHNEVALFGDEGIYKATGAEYWNLAVQKMLTEFRDQHIVDGLVKCILSVGTTLEEKFPYNPSEDRNELPDEIVFGK